MNDLISVIVPVYNHSRVLEKCVASIYAQTHRPLEVIMVNDGSTDNFLYQMEKILKYYPDLNIKIINQTHGGANAARNHGFSESNGAYVIFWDADTVAKKMMLEKMLMALKQNPNRSYAYSQFYFGFKKIKSHPWDLALLKKNNYIDFVSLLRRDDFMPLDETLKRFQDWDLWLTLTKNNKTGVFVPEVLYKKIVGGRKGISRWLPGFMYRFSFYKPVKEYEAAAQKVRAKHGLK